ncbi:hypothetical protein HQ584_02835 [Patescibacteria group bacterium]|nr:hypothetical protein [Patescibacteria group bacterium]
MPEGKAEAEVLKKLEEDMKVKTKEIQEILEKLQAESMKSPEELMKKVGDAKDVKVVADAVKEMQQKVGEKRQIVEALLKEIQAQMEQLRTLKEQAQKEDVTEKVKSLLLEVRDKKASLEKAIGELQELKAEYTKKFFG